MQAPSAAAARPVPVHEESPLRARLERLLDGGGAGGRERLAARLLPTASRDRASFEGFYWLGAAEWLADRYGVSASWRGRELLADLCWIQYCVYALFRVQDDLVDGESGDPLLAVEANDLAIEAARCAAGHFEGGSFFWRHFQHTIAATSRALVALDVLQRRTDREPHAELALYRDQASCLHLATVGVAAAAGREREWSVRVSPALGRLAVAAQILDDLDDIEDDLAEGRINYAVWSLTRPVFGSGPEALRAVVASNLATTDRLAELLAVPRRLLAEALEALGPTTCPPLADFLSAYRDDIDRRERDVATRRDALFARPAA